MIFNVFLVANASLENERPTIPLLKAVEETIHIKRDTGRRERYIKELELYLKLFCRGRETMPIQAIGVDEIKDWFDTRKEKPVTRAANLGRLSALFNVCWRRGYIPENPCLKIERPFIDLQPPKIFTLHQCAKALIWTMRNQPEFLAWLSLALLAGVRPEEVDRLTWDCIDLQRGELRIDAAASKVRTRRIVRLTLACRAWLTIAKAKGAPLTLPFPTRRERRRKLQNVLGFKSWPQDILRHTAASYLLARHQDAGKVAMMLGNSADILNQHYKELVPVEKGVRFCNLLPSPAMVRRVA
jgi:integrase/recombinase XerD